MEPITRLKIETAVATGLVAAPWWVDALQNINLVASTIAGVCAAIYGIYTMMRLVSIYREKKRLQKEFK